MRIIPVSSGKGGVGKTTFALNFSLALGRTQRTVLIDLDTGTSSLRNAIGQPVGKDLYHFIRKGATIEECLHPLGPALDPDRVFSGFQYLPSPKNFIHDIVNFSGPVKDRIIEGINSLRADFVILDLKAGLDSSVLDFLPYTNSGIILFTPKVRAATVTAAEMAKAVLLRMLRLLFRSRGKVARSFPVFRQVDPALFALFIDVLEDAYDSEVANVDDFLTQIAEHLPDTQFLALLQRIVDRYGIYFVLNQFNSVEESADQVIRPFLETIHQTVSRRLHANNLGWVAASDEIQRATETGVPFLVLRHYERKTRQQKEVSLDNQLRDLCGLQKRSSGEGGPRQTENVISSHIDLLHKMYLQGGARDPEVNFAAIADRARAIADFTLQEFGMKRLHSEEEFAGHFLSGNQITGALP